MESVIYQRQHYGCGYACVKMALIYLSSRKDYALIEEDDLDGPMTLKDVIRLASGYGLALEGMKGPLETCPDGSIMLIHGDKGCTHMAFYVGRRGKRHLLLDPSAGRLLLSEEDMARIYGGAFLRTISFLSMDGTFPKDMVFPLRKTLLPVTIATLLPNILLLLSMFLLTLAKVPLFLPVISLSLALVAIALSRLVFLHQMKRFDDTFLERQVPGENEDWTPFLADYQSFKGLLFTTLPSTISCVTTLLISGLFLSLLDPYLGIALLLGLGVLGLFYLTTKGRKLQIESDINIAERLLSYDCGLPKAPLLHRVSQLSDRYGKYQYSFEIITVALSLLFSVGLLFLEGRIEIGNLILYGLGLYYCFQSALRLLRFPAQYEQQKKKEGYFMQQFNPKE